MMSSCKNNRTYQITSSRRCYSFQHRGRNLSAEKSRRKIFQRCEHEQKRRRSLQLTSDSQSKTKTPLNSSSSTNKKLKRGDAWQSAENEVHVQAPSYKVNIHGFCQVGKTALLQQLVATFSDDDKTFGKENTQDRGACLEFQEIMFDFTEIDVLRKDNIKDADVHLVVFSLNDISSMKYAIERIIYLRWKCRIESPIVIVGNKADIVRNRPNFKNDLKFMSKKLNCVYLEASALLNYNISDIISNMISCAKPKELSLSEPKKFSIVKALLKYVKFWKRR